MLRPAQLYKEELNKKFIGIWYDLSYMWYAMGAGMSNIEPGDNNYDSHFFVSVDSKDQVIGFISYNINWDARSATSLGIIAFERFNLTFGRDVIKAIENIFLTYRMNRLSFYSIADNPVIESYRRFVRRYGGTQSGYEHQSRRLLDGTLHDVVHFEIMAEDFLKRYTKKNA